MLLRVCASYRLDFGFLVDLKEEYHACPSHLHGEDEEESPRFHSLEEENFVNNPLCEPHHLGGSLKEGEDNIKEAK